MATPQFSLAELFTSVVDVWVVWVVGVACLAWAIRRAVLQRPWRSWRRFAADERGASYAMSYVLTFPFYLILMCLILQATLILMVKMGTVYAAYAAARTAIVWQPSRPHGARLNDDRNKTAKKRAKRAAVMAMTPFSSGYAKHRIKMFPASQFQAITSVKEIALYVGMYKLLGSSTAKADKSETVRLMDRYDTKATAKSTYVTNKAWFATLATDVRFEGPGKGIVPWNKDFEVTVTHEMPMHVPAVGRVFGQSSSWRFFARKVSTTVKLPSEAPATPDHRLGIPYDPLEMVK